MTPKEFREQGYLMELNRRFLHPLGLALEVEINDHGVEAFGAVWDCRSDAEGIMFSEDELKRAGVAEAARRIRRERSGRCIARQKRLRFMIQPIPEP